MNPRNFKALLWLLPLFYVLEMSLRPIFEADLFFYLALVERFMMSGSWPITDPFVYTLPEEPLMTLHQWLGYWMFYGSYFAAGWAGPILLKTVLVIAFFLIPLLPFLRRRAWPPAFFPLLWCLAFFVAHHRVRERVSLFGDLLALGLSAGLIWGKDRIWFWRALPLMFWLWAQVHPSYPLGFVILGLFVLCDFKNVRARGWWKWIAASVVITLLHPLGWRGFSYPFMFSWTIEPYLSRHVMEWLPLWDPRIFPYVFLYVPFFTLIPWTAFRLLQSPEPRRYFNWALWLLALALTVKSVRFGMLAQGLTLLLVSDQELKSPLAARRFQTAVLAAMAAALMAFKVYQNPQLGLPLSQRLSLDTAHLPLRAAEVLKKARPQMPLFNSFAYGGYLAWAWQGHPPIFFHGFSTNFRFFEDFYLYPMRGRRELDELIAKFDLGVFLLTKTGFDGDYIRLLTAHPGWQVMYEDESSVIFIKKDSRVFPQE